VGRHGRQDGLALTVALWPVCVRHTSRTANAFDLLGRVALQVSALSAPSEQRGEKGSHVIGKPSAFALLPYLEFSPQGGGRNGPGIPLREAQSALSLNIRSAQLLYLRLEAAMVDLTGAKGVRVSNLSLVTSRMWRSSYTRQLPSTRTSQSALV
jgi:hypothetical protein